MLLKNKRKTVALIYGGKGRERDVSKKGAAYLRALIGKDKYRLIDLYIDTKGGFWLEDKKGKTPAYPVRIRDKKGLLVDGKIIPVHAAFPLLHGDYGEDGRIQGALDTAGINYVGCTVSAGSLICDKVYTKYVAKNLGIPVVDFISKRGASESQEDMLTLRGEAEKKIGYPMFIKPISLGSSVGASRIACRSEFERAYLECIECSSDVMIEKYLSDRRELECAYLSVFGEQYFSGAGEIKCDGVYTYSEKYSKSSRASATVGAEVTQEVAETLKGYSLLLVRELGVRHLCRIDYFLSGGIIYLNEINTMPGFTEASLYPKLIATLGIAPSVLVNSLIEDALGDRRI